MSQPAASQCCGRASGLPKSCAFCRARPWWSLHVTLTSPTRNWRRGSTNLSPAPAIPHYSAQLCCNWRGTMCLRRSTGENPPSNCTPMADCRLGAGVSGAPFTATTNSPMRYCRPSTSRCPRSISAASPPPRSHAARRATAHSGKCRMSVWRKPIKHSRSLQKTSWPGSVRPSTVGDVKLCKRAHRGWPVAHAASRLALRAPARSAASALTRPARRASGWPCGRPGVPTAKGCGIS
jgi:hypothetical protein